MNTVNVSRRSFLKATGVTGGGLIVGFSLSGCSSPEVPMEQISGAFEPDAFLQITPNNIVRFYFPRDEMGQGAIMGLTTLVAEELDISPTDIDVVFSGVHPDYNNPEFGMQGTGGSTSIKVHFYPLRQSSANVRAVILDAAAIELGVPRTSLSTADAHVINAGERYPYGQFVAKAAELPLPEDAPLTPRSNFKYIGKDIARIDSQSKSTGTAVYGIDVDIPNLHHAVVKRCPVAGGTVVAYDSGPVLALPGVTDVVEIASGVAVVAEKFWQAKKAAAALQVEWDLPEFSGVSTAQIKADYQQAMHDEEGDSEAKQGDLEQGFAAADTVIENEYWAPYLAHAPLEPMNAVVRIENGRADLWSGNQGPTGARGLVARYADLPVENVTVHNVFLGGGFGRRGVLTHIVEATQTAVAAGKPVQLVWTREDDIQNGFYRPASLMSIKGGVDDQGNITGWFAKRVGGNIMPDTLRMALPGLLPTAVPEGLTQWMAGVADSVFDGWVVDHAGIEGLFEDYDFPNREVRHVTKNHGLPLTFWRSVGHSFTAFAKETMIDELAEQAGRDPVDFRLQNTHNNPRLNNVIRLAGERMRQLPKTEGRALGLSAHGSFFSYVAQAAEVSVDNGQITVHRVVCVLDCGQVVNPDIVKGQMEGSIMFGLTAALHGNIEIENGTVKESNFHNYPILRMNEAPEVEVIIVDSDEDPTGVGEPGLPPIAPAVANAVYKATGQRLRSMPLKLA